MIIGVPKEIKDHEYRVSLTPDGVRTLRQAGHAVLIEPEAGHGSGFEDEEYRQAGGQIATSREQLFQESDLIVKVKEPLPVEYRFFRPKLTVFTYLHLAASAQLTKALMESGTTGIAYETIETPSGSLPILEPMSEIAGKMAVQIGAHYLERAHGGRGILLGGLPGVDPGLVVILGAGVVGSAATRIAVGMGARVTVINLDVERLRELDERYQGRITTLPSHQTVIDRVLPEADLVVGAVMVRGAKAPKLVPRKLVSRMRPGSVIVDVAVDQGGCFETTRPTSHSDPVYEVDGVLHYCVANMPGIVPRTSTLALTNATLPYIVRIASMGVEAAIRENPGLAKGVNVMHGRVTCEAVAAAHHLPFARLV
jgi:alanine dehydrogenase